ARHRGRGGARVGGGAGGDRACDDAGSEGPGHLCGAQARHLRRPAECARQGVLTAERSPAGRAADGTSSGARVVGACVDARPPRNDAIDCLRGVVMILMALDHARLYVGPSVDLQTAAPALYFTRWITHFCAPVFVLLAGLAAWLHGRRLGSTRAISGYLFTRGLWLAVLEVTVIRAVWMAYIGPQILVLQVIWVIGASMMVLAGLVWLPRAAIAAFAAVVIAGHNLLDVIQAEQLGSLRWLWLLLHEEGRLVPFTGASWFVIYPLIPWVAVMAAGYVIGPWAL